MPSSKKHCFAEPFSHIYVEKQIRHHEGTQRIIAGLPNATVVEIENYKHVFNRRNQNAELQKRSPKLILAFKQPPYMYPFSEKCQQGSFDDAVYVTPALGCRFDCDFCFLHGMYNSANLVVFINTEDMFEALLADADKDSPQKRFVSLSYETDLLALESMCGLTRDWIQFAKDNSHMMFECRTRSGQFRQLADLAPQSNFLLSWSINPNPVIKGFEHGAPSLESRIAAAQKALAAGWPVRLCIDPVIPMDGWKALYAEMIDSVFSQLPGADLYDVTTGPFRMGKDFFKRIRKARPWCDLYFKNMIISPNDFENAILSRLRTFMSKEKLVKWESPL